MPSAARLALLLCVAGAFRPAVLPRTVRPRRTALRAADDDDAPTATATPAKSFMDSMQSFFAPKPPTNTSATAQKAKAEKIDADVSDAEVEAFYTANAQQFMTPERVVLDTLTLARKDFFDQVEVDEEAVQQLYEREIGNLAEQRRAAPPLADDDDHRPLAERAASGDLRLKERRQRLELRAQPGGLRPRRCPPSAPSPAAAGAPGPAAGASLSAAAA